jgi:hypothetical protein
VCAAHAGGIESANWNSLSYHVFSGTEGVGAGPIDISDLTVGKQLRHPLFWGVALAFGVLELSLVLLLILVRIVLAD